MIRTAYSLIEANRIADEIMRTLEGTDWEIKIIAPLFAGDVYTISVG